MEIIEQSVELLSEIDSENIYKQIELFGRNCYKSEEFIKDKSSEQFIKMLLKRNHLSVFEHFIISFRIITDRGISHELVRHRIASYSQESTRYCNYNNKKFNRNIKFIKIPDLNLSEQEEICKYLENKYFDLIENGVKPEIARNILPTCLKTEIIATMNIRQWIYFLNLRLTKYNHPQMQEIANMIYKILNSNLDLIFNFK